MALKWYLGFVPANVASIYSLRKHNCLTILLLVKVVRALSQIAQLGQADVHAG